MAINLLVLRRITYNFKLVQTFYEKFWSSDRGHSMFNFEIQIDDIDRNSRLQTLLQNKFTLV